jgi:hypothetical protein
MAKLGANEAAGSCGASEANGEASSTSSTGLIYAYLVSGQTGQPTHVFTLPNTAAAEEWYQQASKTSGVERDGSQMFFYDGAAPRPAGKGVACMPIQTVQPIIPLQHSNGYPICCKPNGLSRGSNAGGGTYSPSSGSGASKLKNDFAKDDEEVQKGLGGAVPVPLPHLLMD